ncbi:MAG: Ig-like domain-containing protein [Pirellulales bacterium]
MQDDGGTALGGVDLDPTANQLTIHVTSVNDAPAGTDTAVTTLEDTPYTFTASDFGFTDAQDSPANSLSAVKITTLPLAGSLTLNGVAVTAGQSVSVASINSGLLRFTPSLHANGTNYASFTFQVQDDGGTALGGVDLDPTANQLTIHVTSVNDAPAGTDTAVTTLEDTPYTFTASDFGFTDAQDSPANSLSAVKITTLPLAGSLDAQRSRGHGGSVGVRGQH